MLARRPLKTIRVQRVLSLVLLTAGCGGEAVRPTAPVVLVQAEPQPEPEPEVASGSAELSGQLDLEFGDGGKLLVEREAGEQRFSALAVLKDGSVAAAGYAYFGGTADIAVAHITTDGRLDAKFGERGVLRVGQRRGFGDAIALARDGKLLVGGHFHGGKGTDALLARLDAKGRLDPSFGEGGMVVGDHGTNDQPHAILVRPDGSFVVVGHRQSLRLGAVAYRADGSLDPRFGDGGVAKFGEHPGTRGAYITRAVMARDGSIIAGGYDPHAHTGVVTRLTPVGQPDTRFGDTGTILIERPAVSSAWAVAVDVEGRALLGFDTKDGSAAIVRLRPDGIRDEGFGRDGVAIADPNSDDQFYALLFDAERRIVAVGFRGLADSASALVARFTARGQLDSEFGENGISTQRFGGGTFQYAAGWDNQGRLVTCGDVWQGNQSRALVVRYR